MKAMIPPFLMDIIQKRIGQALNPENLPASGTNDAEKRHFLSSVKKGQVIEGTVVKKSGQDDLELRTKEGLTLRAKGNISARVGERVILKVTSKGPPVEVAMMDRISPERKQQLSLLGKSHENIAKLNMTISKKWKGTHTETTMPSKDFPALKLLEFSENVSKEQVKQALLLAAPILRAAKRQLTSISKQQPKENLIQEIENNQEDPPSPSTDNYIAPTKNTKTTNTQKQSVENTVTESKNKLQTGQITVKDHPSGSIRNSILDKIPNKNGTPNKNQQVNPNIDNTQTQNKTIKSSWENTIAPSKSTKAQIAQKQTEGNPTTKNTTKIQFQTIQNTEGKVSVDIEPTAKSIHDSMGYKYNNPAAHVSEMETTDTEQADTTQILNSTTKDRASTVNKASKESYGQAFERVETDEQDRPTMPLTKAETAFPKDRSTKDISKTQWKQQTRIIDTTDMPKETGVNSIEHQEQSAENAMIKKEALSITVDRETQPIRQQPDEMPRAQEHVQGREPQGSPSDKPINTHTPQKDHLIDIASHFTKQLDLAQQLQAHFNEKGLELIILPFLFSGLSGTGQWIYWKEGNNRQNNDNNDSYNMVFELSMQNIGQLTIHLRRIDSEIYLAIYCEKEHSNLIREHLEGLAEGIKTLGFRIGGIELSDISENIGDPLSAVLLQNEGQHGKNSLHVIT